MNKESTLYGIICLLIGLIIGYVGANYLNRAYKPPGEAAAGDPASRPANHAGSGDATASADGGQADVMALIQQARRETSNFEIQLQAADLYFQINRPEQSIEFLERALKIKPNDEAALQNMAVALIAKGDKNQALETLNKLEKVNPANQAAPKLRAQINAPAKN